MTGTASPKSGVLAGVAFNDAGEALAGMGVDSGDYDNDGLFDFFVTNYQWRDQQSLPEFRERVFRRYHL